MKNRSMVEVFDIVKEYHYLYKEGGDKHMCVAATNAFLDEKISVKERDSLISLIEGEMQRYADSYIPKRNNFRVGVNTTLNRVIIKAILHYDKLEDLDDLYERVQKIIPIWWESFYEKLRLLED